MLNISKILNICIFITIMIGLIIIVYLIATPYIYRINSEGKIINNEKVYDDIYNIISKKYEVILYEESKELYDLYSRNNNENIKSFIESQKYDEIIEKYQKIEIKQMMR